MRWVDVAVEELDVLAEGGGACGEVKMAGCGENGEEYGDVAPNAVFGYATDIARYGEEGNEGDDQHQIVEETQCPGGNELA